MRTEPHRYRRGHELPGWYDRLRAVTPESRWTTGADVGAFVELCRAMGGPLVLRDFVKSEKHHWHEAAFVPDGGDGDAVRRTADRFIELRGDHLAGGLVARRFERFVGAEVRTWWVDGACVARSAHPDTPDRLPPPGPLPGAIASVLSTLDLGFAVADLVRDDAGRWRVVEVGDGQVSGAPPGMDLTPVLRALAHGR